MVIIPYKSINLLGIKFKIAQKGNWIKFTDDEINSFIKSEKITKDELLKSHEIDQISESKEIVKKIRILALNRVEIIGYIAENTTKLASFKSVKDTKKLREKFYALVKSDKKLEDHLNSNNDLVRSSITDEFKEITTKEVRDSSPVFNFKRLLKFTLESDRSKNPVSLNWTISKAKK